MQDCNRHGRNVYKTSPFPDRIHVDIQRGLAVDPNTPVHVVPGHLSRESDLPLSSAMLADPSPRVKSN